MMSRAAIGFHLLGGFSLRDTGLPGSGQEKNGASLRRSGPSIRPRRAAAFHGRVGRRADAAAAAAETLRSVWDRGRHRGWHRETMAPQNLGTFCLLLLYLIGAVIAG